MTRRKLGSMVVAWLDGLGGYCQAWNPPVKGFRGFSVQKVCRPVAADWMPYSNILLEDWDLPPQTPPNIGVLGS